MKLQRFVLFFCLFFISMAFKSYKNHNFFPTLKREFFLSEKKRTNWSNNAKNPLWFLWTFSFSFYTRADASHNICRWRDDKPSFRCLFIHWSLKDDPRVTNPRTLYAFKLILFCTSFESWLQIHKISLESFLRLRRAPPFQFYLRLTPNSSHCLIFIHTECVCSTLPLNIFLHTT